MISLKKAAAVCIPAIVLPTLSLAAPGDLDTSFAGGDGIFIQAFDASSDWLNAVALQSDGKIVAAGYSSVNSGDFLVVRFNADGTLDNSFGTAGVVTTSIGASTELANAVAVQNDGKIVVAGYAFFGGQYDAAIVRYNTDGSLDTTFGGGDGIVTTSVAAIITDAINAIAIDASGNIWAAGTTWGGATGEDFLILSYDTDGNLNAAFDADGILSISLGTTDRLADIAIQSDGRVVVTGTSGALFNVLRLNADGSFDATFGGGDGIQTTPVGSSASPTALLIQPDNRIVLAGSANPSGTSSMTAVRYNTDGSLDGGFGTGGFATVPVGTGQSVATDVLLQPDGKIILTGYALGSGTSYDFALTRLNANGTVDTTFGTAGSTTTPLGTAYDLSYRSALQADGRIVLAGYSEVGGIRDSAIVRYMGGSASVGATAIPTLSEWGLMILTGLLALGAIPFMRRHRA